MLEKRKRDNMSDAPTLGPLSQPRNKSGHSLAINQQSRPAFEARIESPFISQEISLYLPIPPISQLHPIAGICAEHLSPLILTYYIPLKGVVLAYSKVHLSQESSIGSTASSNATILAKSIDEYAASHVWITAEFLLFRPRRGCQMEGWVNLQNESHIGLISWNFFSASIEKERMPCGWNWVNQVIKGSLKNKFTAPLSTRAASSIGFDEKAATCGAQDDTGHFEDEDGNRIEGIVHFRVKDVEISSSVNRERGIISIEGSCLSGEQERRTWREKQRE